MHSRSDTRLQTHVAKRGGHILPVAAIVTGWINVACWNICDHDQVFWLAKCAWSLDHSLLRLLIVSFSRVNGQIAAMHSWSIDLCSLNVTLIRSKRALITWFNFDPGHKYFYTRHISNYTPWLFNQRIKMNPSLLNHCNLSNQKLQKEVIKWSKGQWLRKTTWI